MASKRDGQALSREAKLFRNSAGKGERKNSSTGGGHGEVTHAAGGFLNSLATEMEFMYFAQMGVGGILPTLGKVSAAWHAKVDGTSLSMRSPLRMMLTACLFKELGDRSTRVMAPDGNEKSFDKS